MGEINDDNALAFPCSYFHLLYFCYGFLLGLLDISVESILNKYLQILQASLTTGSLKSKPKCPRREFKKENLDLAERKEYTYACKGQE